MQLTVKSYRGIDRAEIVIPEGQITLLAAKNNRGKTSIVEALVCNLEANPFPLELAKKDIGHVIHHGAKGAEITFETRHGKRTIVLPACEVKTSSGTGMNASQIALGRLTFGSLTKEQLANVLSKHLNVDLDRKRLELELSEIKILDKYPLADDLKKVIGDTVFGTEKLQAKGWDAGEKTAKEHATIRKTQFKTTTNVTWGSSQGFTFIPQGWEPDLENADISVLRDDVVKAREALERAIAENAVSEAEAETLKAAKAAGTEAQEKFHQANLDVTALEERYESLKERMMVAKCSGCGLHGNIVRGELVPLDEEIAKEKNLGETVANLKKSVEEAKQKRLEAEIKIKKAAEAEKQLAKATIVEDSPVQPARDALARAEKRLEAKNTKTKGVEMHVQVLALLAAAEILGSEGLRKRVLVSQLEEFNKSVAFLCSTAGWSQVQITRDLAITYDNKPYVTLSKSEKYKVDRTLQLAIAQIEKAPIVVLDEADVLDRDGRNQLFRLLITLQVTAVVAMTIIVAKDGTRDVADLRSLGYGITYWVEDAKVQELNAPQAVA